jgi:hypothetical protein
MADTGICSAPGCDKLAYTKRSGLCAMHATRLKRGGTLERRMPIKTIEQHLDGRSKIGMWHIIGEGAPYIRPDNKAPVRTARCRCECGTVRDVPLQTLKSAPDRHCGCQVSARTIAAKTTHGMSKTAEYRSWSHLKERCLNPNCADYENYGGRGIAVCDRWLNSFEAFLQDMGAKPSSGHSIDRINVDGNYEPSNCRWATGTMQGRNKRIQRIVHYQGRDMTLTEACERARVPMKLVHGRMRQQGLSFAEALSAPIMTAKEASRLGTAAKIRKYGHA